MTQYPRVLSESDTLERVLAGASLARYGDGEFTLAEGRSIVNQPRQPELCARLRGILLGDGAPCLVGIPNIQSRTPKTQFWERYKRCASLLSPGESYVSSFVSRPDSAPWIDTRAYWDRIDALWNGLDVTLVRGGDPPMNPKKPTKRTGGISLVASDLTTARSVREVVGPAVNAWADYARLLDEIGRPARVLICLGATATVMAVDLCRRGVHAIDIGHVGMFLRWHRAGEPMTSHPRSVVQEVA